MQKKKKTGRGQKSFHGTVQYINTPKHNSSLHFCLDFLNKSLFCLENHIFYIIYFSDGDQLKKKKKKNLT